MGVKLTHNTKQEVAAMTISIGHYVRRNKPGVFTSKIHYVDSTVSGDVVTRCGKRMRDELGGLEQVAPLVAAGSVNLCKTCGY